MRDTRVYFYILLVLVWPAICLVLIARQSQTNHNNYVVHAQAQTYIHNDTVMYTSIYWHL